jgi:hypothetical protein
MNQSLTHIVKLKKKKKKEEEVANHRVLLGKETDQPGSQSQNRH